MKYMILIQSNPHFSERWEKLSDSEREEFGRRHYTLRDELADSGELVIAEALGDLRSASGSPSATVRR